MSIAAAVRITSPDQSKVIEHAAAFAQQRAVPCFVISVVDQLPYGRTTEEEREIVLRNLDFISQCKASPVLQEGDNVPQTLLAVARLFGVRMLFLQRGNSDHPIAEQLLRLDPPFDVVVVGSE